MTSSILLGIDKIMLSHMCTGKLKKVFITLFWNSRKVSFSIFSFKACCCSSFRTKWNRFSIGFKSGLLGGIANTSAFSFLSVFLTFVQFWLGSPSCNTIREELFPDNLKMLGKFCFTCDWKYFPSRFSYGSHAITPFWNEILTNSLTTFPPVPSFLPLPVQPKA